MTFSALSVTAALTILNITVFKLKKDSEVLTDSIPRTSGILAFSFSGMLFIFFVLALILSGIARGKESFFLGHVHASRRKAAVPKGRELDNYDHIVPLQNQGPSLDSSTNTA